MSSQRQGEARGSLDMADSVTGLGAGADMTDRERRRARREQLDVFVEDGALRAEHALRVFDRPFPDPELLDRPGRLASDPTRGAPADGWVGSVTTGDIA